MVIIASAFQRSGRGDQDIISAAEKGLQILPLTEIPMIVAGDDLVTMVIDSMCQQEIRFEDDDIVVIAQKIVSKAEGRIVRLADVQPTDAASLVMGETTEKVPCVIVRGVAATSSDNTAADCNRPVEEDLFLQ